VSFSLKYESTTINAVKIVYNCLEHVEIWEKCKCAGCVHLRKQKVFIEGGIIVSEREKEGPFGQESIVREGIFSAESASAKMIEESTVVW